jgi:tetratricopeptide (TPR) repeat protein
MIALFSSLRSKAFLLLTALIVCAGSIAAQTADIHILSSQERIAQALESVQAGEQKHLAPDQQGALWEQLALEYHVSSDFPKAENAYLKAVHLFKTAPSAQVEYAEALDNLSALYLIFSRLDDAESARKQAIKVLRKLALPAVLGESEVHMADIALARHQFKKAERLAQEGLQFMASSSNPPRTGVISGYIALAFARCASGHCEEGLANAKQAVAFADTHFLPASTARGFALETLGYAQWKTGSLQEGEKNMLQSIQMLRAALGPTDPRLAGVLLQYHAYLTEAHRAAEAQEVRDQVTRMTSQAGVYCQVCTVSVSSFSLR